MISPTRAAIERKLSDLRAEAALLDCAIAALDKMMCRQSPRLVRYGELRYIMTIGTEPHIHPGAPPPGQALRLVA